MNFSQYTEFAKVKEIWNDIFHDKKGLNEFLKNVVMNDTMTDENNHNGHSIMLPDLSDIYVLVSKEDFPFDQLEPTQKKSIDLSMAKKNFVLGYIWLCPWKVENEECVPIHFICFIDSRISGLNIARYMIDEYEGECEERYLLPYEIDMGAKKYWKRYLMEVYDVKNKKNLQQMMKEIGVESHDVKWENLYEVFSA